MGPVGRGERASPVPDGPAPQGPRRAPGKGRGASLPMGPRKFLLSGVESDGQAEQGPIRFEGPRAEGTDVGGDRAGKSISRAGRQPGAPRDGQGPARSPHPQALATETKAEEIMARSARDSASRASMDYRAMQREGGASSSERRRATVHESMRKTAGEEAVAFWAKKNSNIVAAESSKNIDLVNDGAGGFRPARSLDDVVGYGDAREERVSGLRDGHRVALTIVGQLPLSMCEEVPGAYVVHDENGEVVGTRPRLVARDHDEMLRYFSDWIEFQSEKLPGGQAAMHGYSINLDEGRPHIQMVADPFEAAPTKSDPTRLKNSYSRAFGSHPSDRLVPGKRRDGTVGLVREGASRKMERYHAELKAHMLEHGWEIEAERDPVRHDRRSALPDFQAVEDGKRVLDIRTAELGAREAALESRAATVEAAQAGLAGREEAVAAAEDALPAMRRRAKEEGRAEGRAEGLAGAEEEKRAILDEARKSAQAERLEIAQRAQRAAARIEADARQNAERVLDQAEARVAARVTEAGERIDEIMDAARVDAAKIEEGLRESMPAMYLDKTKAMAYSTDGVSVHDHVLASMEADPRLKGKTAAERKRLLTETKAERGARVRGEINRFLHKDRSQQQSQQQQDRGHDGPSM